MVTLDELHRQIRIAAWFARLGQFQAPPGIVAVQAPAGAPADLVWFPSDAAAVDPVHGDALEALANERGRTPEVVMAALTAAKWTRVSLRRARRHPLLAGPGGEDMAPAAHEAAVYACRRAAVEICLARSGFWANLVPLFRVGHWPLGRDGAGRLVVL